MLLNGQYTIYLRATDMGGNVSEDSAVVRVTGDMKIGNFSLTFEEVSIPVAGIPVTVSRTYDTRRRNQVLDFGHGWSVDYQNVRVHESRKLGFSWQIREIRDGTITRFCSESNGDRVVTVTLSDGAVESFRAVVVPQCTVAVPEPNVQLAFEAIDGTDSALARAGTPEEKAKRKAGTPENFPPTISAANRLDPPNDRPLAPEPGASPTPQGAHGADKGCLARSGRERTCDAQAAQPALADGGGLVE